LIVSKFRVMSQSEIDSLLAPEKSIQKSVNKYEKQDENVSKKIEQV